MAILTVQSTGVTDIEINSSVPTENKDSTFPQYDGVGEVEGSAEVRRTLVKFDISSIPAGSIINSATLTMTPRVDQSANARTLSVYRCLRAWVETQATWNVYSTGNNWGTAGCSNTTSDREATDIGTSTQPASPTIGTGLNTTLTASKIQEMITGGVFTNNGFLLQVATETDDCILYDSRTQGADGPKLVIDYTPPATTADTSYSYFL